MADPSSLFSRDPLSEPASPDGPPPSGPDAEPVLAEAVDRGEVKDVAQAKARWESNAGAESKGRADLADLVEVAEAVEDEATRAGEAAAGEPAGEKAVPIAGGTIDREGSGHASGSGAVGGEPWILAEAVTERRRAWPLRVLAVGASAVHWCFGALSLLLGLALLASLPVLQFLSLGYLLEAAGRVGRSGRIRDGFVGVRKAAHVGGLVLGTWLLLLPLRVLSDLWYSAYLIDPAGSRAAGWRVALIVATVLLVGQILWAWFRGGRLRDFFWPAPVRLVKRLPRGGKYVEARDRIWEFVVGLRLPHYFWLGLRGFAGAALWLAIPALLLIGGGTLSPGPAFVSGWLGALTMAWVVLHLPFLQARFAAENRFGCFFELKEVRERFRRAPIAFWFAVLITLLFALPLYLLKIELTPREVVGLTSVVFVAFIFPARLLTGWALSRAERRHERRWWIVRWTARLGMLPVVFLYILIVFISRYTSWQGVWTSLEQHAFLVPVPFLGL